MKHFNGIPIHVTPDRPKRQLSEDVPVTDAFRVEFNQWMREFFGVINVLEDGYIIKMPNGLYMNPRTMAEFDSRLAGERPKFQLSTREYMA